MKWLIILIAAVLAFAGFLLLTRFLETKDAPKVVPPATFQGLMYNRANNLVAAIKTIRDDEGCLRMISGICGERPRPSDPQLRGWWHACSCEVTKKVCQPAFAQEKLCVRRNQDCADCPKRLSQKVFRNMPWPNAPDNC